MPAFVGLLDAVISVCVSIVTPAPLSKAALTAHPMPSWAQMRADLRKSRALQRALFIGCALQVTH